MSQLTEKQLSEDWDFLKCIHSLLDEGNVLNTASDKPVVTFQFPNELQVCTGVFSSIKRLI